MFWPLTAQLHALNARGKSGVALALSVAEKAVSVVLLFLTYRHSVWLMVLSEAAASAILLPVNMLVYRKHLGYALRDQIADIAPPVLLSAAMAAVVFAVQSVSLSLPLALLVQVLTGAVFYIAGSVIFKFESFYYILYLIRSIFKNAERGNDPVGK